jgi:hypothetical protein
LRSSSVKVKKTSVKAQLLIFEVVRNRRTENTRSQNPNACKKLITAYELNKQQITPFLMVSRVKA